ncbi:DUF2069 domain-containing protein [Marinobacterium arenosum]|uniref:DUF2069 domain-containing protein n=1 Tax=Marinobacterium arenosum TaxID=2862496 RepID=UPI001C958B5E|nr:DUF2069 domain-containing protein [Marinobacterium arenosum]MBY4677107.1 DUF2069 domain-containing protein [Marinobacterium arenosum]
MTLESKVTLTRSLTLLSYFGLLALFLAWYLVLAPVPGANPWIIVLVQSSLLLAFLPTVIKGVPRGHAWLCFVLLLYFVQAVLAASNPATQGLGLAFCGLVGVLFSAAMYYARWKSRLIKALANNG